jgi:hypothetical protein
MAKQIMFDDAAPPFRFVMVSTGCNSPSGNLPGRGFDPPPPTGPPKWQGLPGALGTEGQGRLLSSGQRSWLGPVFHEPLPCLALHLVGLETDQKGVPPLRGVGDNTQRVLVGAKSSGKQRSGMNSLMKDKVWKRFATVLLVFTAIAVSACSPGDEEEETSSTEVVLQGQTDELTAEETPVKETPVKETPVKETPVKETPVKETPVKETPVKETPARRVKITNQFVEQSHSAGEDPRPDKKEENASYLPAVAMSLGIMTLGLLLFLVHQMRKGVGDLLVVARGNGNSELLLVAPLRAELDSLRKNQKGVGENITKNFGTVQGHLRGTREAVEQLEEEMQSIRDLANSRAEEIRLYQEGIRLSSLKDAMGQVIKGLDFIREGVRATADNEEKAFDVKVADHLEAILREALLAAGVDEYGEEVIGDPIEDHRKHCKAIPNEPADPEYGPGIITSCVRMGYRVLVKPDGEYFSLRVAEVAVNPSTEKEPPVTQEDVANYQDRAL